MSLFLASLAMLFVSALIGYVALRYGLFGSVPPGGREGVLIAPLLWVSTGVIVLSSITLHLARAALRADRVARFRGWLVASLGLAIVFLVTQVPPMLQILDDHWARFAARQAGEARDALSGLVLTLVLVHALHVLGGVIPMIVVWARAKRYTRRKHQGVTFLLRYWHFLDVVWLIMFATLVLTR